MKATPRMATESGRRSLSQASRNFIAGTLASALAICAVVGAVRMHGQRLSSDAASQALEKAAGMQDRLGQQRLRLLELSAGAIGNDPGMASYLAASIGDDLGLGGAGAPDTSSLRDLLDERKEQFGFDLGMLLDPGGSVLARSDHGESLAQTLQADPLMTAALQQLAPQSGYWRFEDRLYQAAVVPMTKDGALLGFLLLAQRIDDALSGELARDSGAEIAFWTLQGDGRPSLFATSLGAERAQALRVALVGGGSETTPTTGGKSPWRKIDLVGEHWLAKSSALPLAGTRQSAIVGALLSSDAAGNGYRSLVGLSLWAGSAGLAAAMALLWVLSLWTRKPLRTLMNTAAAAAAGDYDARPAASGRDEVAVLARSVAHLLSSLREKRDMDAYITDVSRHLPDASATAPTRASRNEPRPITGNGSTDVAGHASLKTGSRLGERYEILDILGSGGMGVVYKVRDLELGELAALKLLRNGALESDEQLERLKDEIRLARKITHPNVLRTFDFGEASGRPFITMEYVHGVTLRALLGSGRLPYSAALRITRQLVAGLEAAHAVGVMHRDIKPENLILETGGNAKLMDFGIARPVHRPNGGLTEVGMVVGSPDYSPPEQIAGGAMDERSDIYSCGVVACELFCGMRPYRGESAVDIYMAQMRNELTRPSQAWPDIPPALEAIILRCLSVQADGRYRSVSELASALAGLKA